MSTTSSSERQSSRTIPRGSGWPGCKYMKWYRRSDSGYGIMRMRYALSTGAMEVLTTRPSASVINAVAVKTGASGKCGERLAEISPKSHRDVRCSGPGFLQLSSTGPCCHKSLLLLGSGIVIFNLFACYLFARPRPLLYSLFTQTVLAQAAPPNVPGVSLGHIHLTVLRLPRV